MQNDAGLGGGGGIYCDNSSPVIDRNILIFNTASVGAGILLKNSNAIKKT